MAAGLGFKTFNTGDVLTSADTNGYLMQGVLVFADAAARSAAITSPQEGQYSYLKDSNSTWYYSGSAWVAAGGSPLTTKGDVYGYSTTDARIPVGANDTVLTADSTTALGVKWAAPGGGGMTLIQTITASAATSVSFTSIPTTYKTLIFVANKVHQSSQDVSWTARFNNDSGTNYQYHGNFVDGNGTIMGRDYGTGTSTSGFGRRAIIPGSDNFAGSDKLAYCELFIYNANSTGTKSYFYNSTGYWDSADSGNGASSGALNMSGTYSGTAAISQIDLIRSFTQTITGTFRLFGVS